MALTVNFLGERLTDASSTTDWSINKLNGAGGGSWSTLELATDDFIQGTSSIRAVSPNNGSNRTHGFVYDYNTAGGRALDFTSGGQDEGKMLWVWGKVVTPTTTGSADTRPGIGVALCTSTPGTEANYAWYAFYGSENYPGGFVRMVVDPSLPPTFSGASYNPSNVTHIGTVITIQSNKPLDAAFVDAIDLGTGIRIFGDTDSQDGVTEIFNESENTTNAFGVLESLDTTNTVYKIRGQNYIGDGTGTDTTNFTGTNSIIVMDNPQHVNSANTDFTNSLKDSFQQIVIDGNSTNPTNVELGTAVGAGDDIDGRAGIIFLGNDQYNYNFNFNAGNVDSLNLYGCTLRNFLPTGNLVWDARENHDLVGCFIDNCSRLDPDSGVRIRNTTFLNHLYSGSDGSTSQGALYFTSESPSNAILDIKNSSFIVNDFAIEHPATGSYTYDNLTFTSNNYDIYLNYTGAGIPADSEKELVINLTNGADATTAISGASSGDIDIKSAVTLTLTNIQSGSEVRIRPSGNNPNVVLWAEENVTDGTSEYTYNFPPTYPNVDIFVMKVPDYKWFSIEKFTLSNESENLLITQIPDRNYSNP